MGPPSRRLYFEPCVKCYSYSTWHKLVNPIVERVTTSLTLLRSIMLSRISATSNVLLLLLPPPLVTSAVRFVVLHWPGYVFLLTSVFNQLLVYHYHLQLFCAHSGAWVCMLHTVGCTPPGLCSPQSMV